jgi:hypothetical protein
VQTRSTWSSTAFNTFPIGTALMLMKSRSSCHLFGSAHVLPIGVSKDISYPDTQCQSFGGDEHTYFRTLNSTSEYDIFLGLVGANHTAPDPLCSVQCGRRRRQFSIPEMASVRATIFPVMLSIQVSSIATSLTHISCPRTTVIHTECLENPKCIGFRIKNDRSSGDLLRRTVDVRGWFQL